MPRPAPVTNATLPVRSYSGIVIPSAPLGRRTTRGRPACPRGDPTPSAPIVTGTLPLCHNPLDCSATKAPEVLFLGLHGGCCGWSCPCFPARQRDVVQGTNFACF